MADERQLGELLFELKRVGVDPNTLSAGLAVRPEHAIKALQSLPAGAGPAAFLASLREATNQSAGLIRTEED